MNQFLRYASYTSLFAVMLCIDRISKWWILTHVSLPYKINQFVSFELVFNRGISWSYFCYDDPFRFFLISSVVITICCALTLLFVKKIHTNNDLIGETLVLSGAWSNVYDRYAYQGVVDFIHICFKPISWPLFNCADCFIVCGVSIMLYQYWRGYEIALA